MRCRGVSDNGVTSKISKEAQRATHLLQSMNSMMGPSPLSVLLVPTRDEIYPRGGIPNLVHARKLLLLLS